MSAQQQQTPEETAKPGLTEEEQAERDNLGFQSLIKNLCTALGGDDWKILEFEKLKAEERIAVIARRSGEMISIKTGRWTAAKAGRILIRGRIPKGLSDFSRYVSGAGLDEITVADSCDSPRMAKEIKSRLLPFLRSYLQDLREARERQEIFRAETAAAVEQIRKAAGWVFEFRQQDPTDYRFHNASGAGFSINSSVSYVTRDSFQIQISSLTIAEGERVAALLLQIAEDRRQPPPAEQQQQPDQAATPTKAATTKGGKKGAKG